MDVRLHANQTINDLLIPDGNWRVAHRVVSVRGTGAVTFGLRGTIISLHKDLAEVVFDEPFLAGDNLGGRCKDFRGFIVPQWSLLNLTLRDGFVHRTRAPATVAS